MPYERVPADTVHLRLQLTRADRDRLHIAAAKHGQSMAAYARKIIVLWLNARDPSVNPAKLKQLAGEVLEDAGQSSKKSTKRSDASSV